MCAAHLFMIIGVITVFHIRFKVVVFLIYKCFLFIFIMVFNEDEMIVWFRQLWQAYFLSFLGGATMRRRWQSLFILWYAGTLWLKAIILTTWGIPIGWKNSLLHTHPSTPIIKNVKTSLITVIEVTNGRKLTAQVNFLDCLDNPDFKVTENGQRMSCS